MTLDSFLFTWSPPLLVILACFITLKLHRLNKSLVLETQCLIKQVIEKTAVYEAMERRAKEYFDVIVVAQKERENWRDLYFSATLAAGNTQNRMVIERSVNMKRMIDAGLHPHTDPIIDALVGAFNEQHYQPVARSKDEKKKESAG